MNLIDKKFRQCRADGRKALIVFVSAGDPSLEFTLKLVPRIVEAGADLIELGVPFSDPMADGPTIQSASERAIAGGASLPRIMELAGQLRGLCPQTPLILFSYYNLILQYGVEKLARDSGRQGIDGWLVVDLPPEEDAEVEPVLQKHGLAKIALLAPNTPEPRIRMILDRARGFVYYITVTGVTGARTELPTDLADHLRAIHSRSSVPVAAGFGVSTPEQARMVGRHADGVIVGSRLVNLVQQASSEDDAISQAVKLVGQFSSALQF